MSVARGKATDFSCVTTKNITMKGANFLEKLLDNQPVEWKKLGEVADYEQPTAYLVKDTKYKDDYSTPVLTAGKTFILGYTNETEGIYEASKHPTIIFDDFTTALRWVDFDFKAKSSAMKMITSKDESVCLLKYIYYWLCTVPSGLNEGDHKRQWISNYANKDFPLPPLSVQSRIVEILDKFTAMEAELEEQLQAELELRKKQYAYYREQLLNFSYTPPNEFNVVYRKLGEVAQYSKGRIEASTLSAKNYVGVDNLLQDCQGKKLSEHVPTEGRCTAYSPKDILIGNIRPYLKKIWFADNAGGTNGDVLVIQTTDERVLPEYLYQVLSDDAFFTYDMQHAKGAKMPRGNKDKILDYKIPLPPLSEQARIVEILDKFDTLTNSISEGLPLEIQLRKQQYEYYREQLLAFPHP